ncbi:hypothetical protein B5M44_08675 [Shinella sumterensis]|nr:hypothetical protein B5M44_08675 [Shinella sumterensis]
MRAEPPHPPAGTFSPLGRRGHAATASFPFSPAGRRWPEGSDEGACATKRKESACRHSQPYSSH